jgi:hypothetical protein
MREALSLIDANVRQRCLCINYVTKTMVPLTRELRFLSYSQFGVLAVLHRSAYACYGHRLGMQWWEVCEIVLGYTIADVKSGTLMRMTLYVF